MFMFNVLINKAFQLFTFRFAPDLARNGIGVRGWTGATFSALFIFFIWSLSPFYQKKVNLLNSVILFFFG